MEPQETAGSTEWGSVERLFWGALNLPTQERGEFLEKATEDHRLRGTVALLLQAHQSVRSNTPSLPHGLDTPEAIDEGFRQRNPHCRNGLVLAGRYKVVRLLGQGGMGTVYEAEDRELGETIAIKAVRVCGESVEAAYGRLKRELRVTRRLTHPNICRVFDIAKDYCDGSAVLFLTMELLRGRTIADHLKRSGKLPFLEVAKLIEPLASALETAHASGILHRDLKPGNIMLVEGGVVVRPVILDFGIAGSLALPNVSLPNSLLVQDGAGTPAYMAPEQLLGRELTGAADFYSLGLVLYEMVCGCPPFGGSSQFQAIFQRLEDAPTDPRLYAPDLPDGGVQLLTRCLNRDPAARPHSASAMLALLNVPERASPDDAPMSSGVSTRAAWKFWPRAVTMLLLLVLLAAGAFFWARRQVEQLPQPARRAALLPFAASDASNDLAAAQARGFSAALSHRLGAMVQQDSVRHAAWIAQDEILAQHVNDVESAHRQLGADWVVQGILTDRNSGLHAVIAVADAATRKIVRTLDVEAGDYEALLAASSAQLGSALGIVTGKSAPAVTHNSAAFQDYLEALGYFARSDKPKALDLAAASLNQAIVRDPRFVQARIQLARTLRAQSERSHDPGKLGEAEYQLDVAYQIAPADPGIPFARAELKVASGRYVEAIEQLQIAEERGLATADLFVALARAYNGVGLADKAEANFREALRRDPESWSARTYLAQFYYRRGWYAKSVQEFQAALRLAPDNARALYSLGGVLLQMGRFDESERCLLRAAALNPTAPVWINLGTLHSKRNQWAEAVTYYEKALEMDAANYQVWASLANGYAHLPGQNDKSHDAYLRAADICRRQLQTKPEDAHLTGDLAGFLAQTGTRQEALELIQRALALAPSDTAMMVTGAEVYEHLGFRTEALDWVKNALQRGYPREGIEGDQTLNSLRSDSRYVAFLTKPPALKN